MAERRFFEQPLLVWFLLLVFPPLGIVLLWIIGHYTVLIRLFLSFIFGLLYIELLGFHSGFIRALLLMLFFSYLLFRYHRIKTYEESTIDLYNNTLNNPEIYNIINNYLSRYDCPTRNYKEILYFEMYLRNKHKIIYKNIRLSNKEDLLINFIYKELYDINKLDELKIKEFEEYNSLMILYEEKIKKLVFVISKKINISSEKFIYYFIWSLIKDISIDYYGKLFKNKYGNEFKDINNIDDYILKYVFIESLSKEENSLDLASFTYYLMKYGPFIKEKDLRKFLNNIYNNIEKQYNKKQLLLFESEISN